MFASNFSLQLYYKKTSLESLNLDFRNQILTLQSTPSPMCSCQYIEASLEHGYSNGIASLAVEFWFILYEECTSGAV